MMKEKLDACEFNLRLRSKPDRWMGLMAFQTGDEASVSADGYVTIIGRIKEGSDHLVGRMSIFWKPKTACSPIQKFQTCLSLVCPMRGNGEAIAPVVVAREDSEERITVEEIQCWVQGKPAMV